MEVRVPIMAIEGTGTRNGARHTIESGMIPCDDAKISRPDNKQTQAIKRMRDSTRPATPPMRNTRPARKRGSNAAMTSMPKRRSGISADTGQGGLTVHRQLNARRHDRDAHLPNQTPHARLACVRASVWVCRCARRIVLHAMAAAAAQFKCAHLDVHNDAHTRAQRQAGPMRTVTSRSFITDAFVSISRLRAAAASSDALRATSALACSLTCSPVLTRATSLQALTPPRAVTRSTRKQ